MKKAFIILTAIFLMVTLNVTVVTARVTLPEIPDGGSTTGGPSWVNSGAKVSCGNISNIPKVVPDLVHLVVLIGQVAVPVILVIMGTFDFIKGIASQKDDEIKRGQQSFLKRLMTGAIVFFVVTLVTMLVNLVGDNVGGKDSIISCIDCFINAKCS